MAWGGSDLQRENPTPVGAIPEVLSIVVFWDLVRRRRKPAAQDG